MKTKIQSILGLAKTNTAKDTLVLFSGNVVSALLGFLFTIVVARVLTVSDFGIYSAAQNLIIILTSLSDIGLSSGVVSFMASHLAKGDGKKADEYAKAAFIVKVAVSLSLSLFIIIFAGYVARHWLATVDSGVAYWVSVLSFLFIADSFLPYILQVKKMFLKSVMIDISVGLPKFLIPLIFIRLGVLTIGTTLLAFAASLVLSVVVGFALTGVKFLTSRPQKSVYVDLAKFSGWLGVNRVISSISGKLDVQMMAALAGAVSTGLYSIPSKLSSFLIVLASSFSAVLAPRFAGFSDKKQEKIYLLKASLVTLGIIGLTIVWIIIARPFILILFGAKYLPAVPVFQALCASMIPYLATIPSVTVLIYAMKKTIYIGIFSFFQLAAIFLLNFIFIPRYGAFGPTITFGVVNTILAVYIWIIVIKHYWFNK